MLAGDSVASGEPLAYEVHATDAFGNTVDGSGAAIIASSTHVTVATGTVSADLVGSYDVTAILDGQSDTESFSVTAGPGATIELVLTPKTLEVGDKATAEVTVTDAAGNDAGDAYTLEVSGVAAAIAGDEITFQGEGWFTVTATLDGTSLADAVGPILIDSTGPDIDVVEPTRALWRGAWLGHDGTESGTITDAWSDVASAERNGETLPLETDGSFSVDDEDAYDWGITVTETTATDTDGNVSTDRRSALLGYFIDTADSARAGIRVRLDDGAGGLDVLEDLGAGLVPADTLGDAIVNPVFEDTSLLYEVSLDVTDPAFASSDLDLDCTTEGIETTFTIDDASLDYDASGKLIGIGYTTDGTITMDSIEVTLLAIPSVSSGAIRTEVTDLDVTIRGFDFPMTNWLEDVLDFFGVDVDEIVQGYVEEALRDSLQEQIPSLLDDTLAGFEMSETLPLFGVDFVFEAVPYDVLFDDDGSHAPPRHDVRWWPPHDDAPDPRQPRRRLGGSGMAVERRRLRPGGRLREPDPPRDLGTPIDRRGHPARRVRDRSGGARGDRAGREGSDPRGRSVPAAGGGADCQDGRRRSVHLRDGRRATRDLRRHRRRRAPRDGRVPRASRGPLDRGRSGPHARSLVRRDDLLGRRGGAAGRRGDERGSPRRARARLPP